MQVNFELNDAQLEFLNSDTNSTLFCGGLGSGKTFSGALWAAVMATTYPEVQGMITANTHSQLRKATLTEFFSILDTMGIKYRYLVNANEIHVQGGAVIHAYSMENYDNMRGVQVGWCWSDECAFYKEIAYQVCRGRIRDKRGTCQWKGTTTPNGYNWLYQRFVEKPADSSKTIYAKTMDNIDNLAESYVQELRQQYDDKLAKQELEGQFVNLSSGKVYYAFDRQQHVKPFDTPYGLTHMGMDFNVNPLCGVFAALHNDTIYVFDELFLEDSNTFNAAKEIQSRYPGRRVGIVADSTGDRRRSSSTYTDHEILRRSGFEVVPFKNPPIKDRYNNLNRLLQQNKIVIHPSCKKLIADLEQLVYENNDEMLGHITDALGYLAWKYFPLIKPRREAQVRNY